MKKLKNDMVDMIKTSVIGGAGSLAVAGTGSFGAQGLTNISAGMGTVGTISSAGAMLRQTKKLGGKKW